MEIFQLDNKIRWRRDANVDISQAFYPSFYKDIMKRDSFFKDNFRVEIIDASIDILKNKFEPLYMSEVASRDDFTLNRNEIMSQLADKIAKNNIYKFLFVYYGNEVVTEALFSLKKDGLYMGYKANKKDFDKTLSHKATVSYWTEKIIFDYGKSVGVKYFSYGKDSNPYFGKTRIGLPLYKIKTGMKPKKPDSDSNFVIAEYSEESLKKRGEPILFFNNPNRANFYTNCFLFCPNELLNESYLKEFEKVFKWAAINLNLIRY